MTEVTGGELLTLWKVGRVGLPKIAQVYLDAIDGLTAARGAAAAYFQPSAAGSPSRRLVRLAWRGSRSARD